MSFSHHATVGSLPPAKADKILAEAAAHGHSVRWVQDAVRRLSYDRADRPGLMANHGGLDTIERIGTALTAQYGERFLPPNALRSLVNAGHYGRKTGRGFSDYAEPA